MADSKLTWLEKIICMLFGIMVGWVIVTILYWIFQLGEPKTLVEILLNQWKYITSLRIW